MKPVTVTTDEARLLRIFKALSHPIRYKMVRHMVENPQCITSDLVEATDLAQSTVSQHLKVLRESGLVCGEVEGPATSYCLCIEALDWFQNEINAVADELVGCC